MSDRLRHSSRIAYHLLNDVDGIDEEAGPEDRIAKKSRFLSLDGAFIPVKYSVDSAVTPLYAKAADVLQ
ncbi:hypothetical protein V1507DRAFT_476628 [Lipomyces tetrasporus]